MRFLCSIATVGEGFFHCCQTAPDRPLDNHEIEETEDEGLDAVIAIVDHTHF
jgi:hypothetical protein